MTHRRAHFVLWTTVNSIWRKLRDTNPELPPVELVLLPAKFVSESSRALIVNRVDCKAVVLAAHDSADNILLALIHAAAFFIVEGTGSKARDSSGKYLPAFARMAISLGLNVEFSNRLGFGKTSLESTLRLEFCHELASLSRLSKRWRQAEVS